MKKTMQNRPNSSKLFQRNHPSAYQEKMLLNKTIKSYYKDYELLRKTLNLKDCNGKREIDKKEYYAAYAKVQRLLDGWDMMDFCVKYSVFDGMRLGNENRLESNADVKEDYAVRRRKCAKEANDTDADVDANRGLREIKENSKSGEEDEYKEDFDNVEIDGLEIEGKGRMEIKVEERKDVSDDEEYKFDEGDVDVDVDVDKKDVSEEYKFDEEDKNIDDQINYTQSHNDSNKGNDIARTNNEFVSVDDNDIIDEFDHKQPNQNRNAKSNVNNNKPQSHHSNHSNSIQEDSFNKSQGKKPSYPNNTSYKKPSNNNHSNSNSLIKTAPFPSKQPTPFFQSSNDKFILDDFESKVFAKEHNLLDHPSNQTDTYYNLLLLSEKKSVIIQRHWRKFRLHQQLNKPRPLLHCQWDKTRRYIIIVLSDHQAKTVIHSIFIRVYSIDKMKTCYDTFTWNQLRELEIIDGELTKDVFKKIKGILSQRIVEMVIEQNERKEEGLDYDTMMCFK